jgi:hypothetical protein
LARCIAAGFLLRCSILYCDAAFMLQVQCCKCNAAAQYKMLRMQCCKCNAASAKGPPANAALQQGMPHRRTPPESSLSPFNWL